ncbi:MAG: TlpA disulfide reductase family protein [Pseudomonadota bacterium]|jgi:thiol-disulfide isomerase/thioredoxin
MNSLPAFGFVLGLVCSTAAMAEGPNAVPLHDTPLPVPAISFADEHGNPLTLDRWRGKVVLLNVWATWCAPCRHEMPTLDALQARLGGPDFHVVPLSIDRAGLEPVRRFYEEIGVRHLDMYLAEDIRAMLAFAVGAADDDPDRPRGARARSPCRPGPMGQP